MRFKERSPKNGEKRIKSCFFLIPRYYVTNTNDRVWVWLETLYYIQYWDLSRRKWEDYRGAGTYFKGWGNEMLVYSRYYISIPKHLEMKYITQLLNSNDRSDHTIFNELIKIVE